MDTLKAKEKDDMEQSSRNPVLKRAWNKKISESNQQAATTEGAALKSLLLLGMVITAAGISCFYTISNTYLLRIILQKKTRKY